MNVVSILPMWTSGYRETPSCNRCSNLLLCLSFLSLADVPILDIRKRHSIAHAVLWLRMLRTRADAWFERVNGRVINGLHHAFYWLGQRVATSPIWVLCLSLLFVGVSGFGLLLTEFNLPVEKVWTPQNSVVRAICVHARAFLSFDLYLSLLILCPYRLYSILYPSPAGI